MFIAQIDFVILRKIRGDEQDQVIYSLLASFLHDGRIGKDYQILKTDKVFSVFTKIPDLDAFENLENHKNIPDFLKKLTELNLSQPNYQILGKTSDLVANCECQNSSAFILYTGIWSSSVTPLYCIDCFNVIPLYRLPRREFGDFFNVYIWQQDYISCDSLQIHCKTGERFGLREMLEYRSSLSQRGLEICAEIKQLTNKPCYYFLYKYRGKSWKIEQERKCPKCNKEWKLEAKLHKLFDFKCDDCQLLANIADSI